MKTVSIKNGFCALLTSTNEPPALTVVVIVRMMVGEPAKSRMSTSKSSAVSALITDRLSTSPPLARVRHVHEITQSDGEPVLTPEI